MRTLICLLAFALSLPFGGAGQHVGLATATPTGPLSFGPVNTNLLWLWHAAYISKNNNQLRFHSEFDFQPDVTLPMLFGYGHTGAFVESMRLSNNGSVGIGVANPAAAYNLDLTGPIRTLQPAGIQGSPAMYFDDPAGSTGFAAVNVSAGNIGITQGNGASRMQYNPLTAALSFNSSYGSAGMALQSGGTGAPAQWKASNYGALYNGVIQQFEQAGYQLVNNGNEVTMDGLTVNLNLPTTARLAIDYNITAYSPYCFTCAPSVVKVSAVVGGTVTQTFILTVPNGFTTSFAGHTANIAFAGVPQTISIKVTKVSGPTFQLPNTVGQNSGITVIPFPVQ